MAAGLSAQQSADGNPWTDLVVTSGGQHLRVLSPQNGLVGNAGFLSGYYDSYVSQVWSKYAAQPLTIDTQAAAGNVAGQVSGGVLTFPGGGSFAAPTTADIFSCSTGPFSTAGANDEALAIIPRLAAAFNRSTLLIDANQPDGENPADYYQNAVTNHYARLVHAAAAGGLGYAFPYDDVTPAAASTSPAPCPAAARSVLTVTVGSVH